MPIEGTIESREVHTCTISFTPQERARMLGIIDGRAFTFDEAVAVKVTTPLNTREQLADYFRCEIKYFQELYNSLKEPKHLQRANAYRTALRFLAVSSD